MRHWKQKAKSLSPDFVLLLLLLFWIPMENTLLGRGYMHVLGLHEGDAEIATLAAEQILIFLQSLLLFTIVVPIAIAVLSARSQVRTNPVLLIRIGLISWIFGGTISTIGNFDKATVILNYAAGILSAGAVFVAVLLVKMETSRDFELAFRVIALGGLIPCLIDLSRYYMTWGIPSIQRVIAVKYDPTYWSLHCLFGNPDNASCAYGILAAMSGAVILVRVFGRTTRILGVIVFALASLEILLTMSRTGIVAALGALVSCLVFRRAKRALALAGLGVLALLVLPGPSGNSVSRLVKYFQPAVKYDVQNVSIGSRIESMQEGWEVFKDNPIIGIGASQSRRFVDESVPHELAIWQAAENGLFALAGVLLVTFSSLWRLAFLMRNGNALYSARLEFVFLLPAAMFFARGLISDVTMNSSFVNTWICLTFAAVALSEKTAAIRSVEMSRRVELQPIAHSLGSPGSGYLGNSYPL